jgi:hypothetical protein
MVEKDNHRNLDDVPGVIQKAASLSAHEVTDEELKEINKHALAPLTAEEVFTFKAVLCDNEVDRTFEQFTQKALQDLQKLFLGKTVIKDHAHRADNQVARIYKTELVQGSKTLKSGEIYTQLVAHCYMVKTASNADLIAEIKGGIKKEGSVGCSITGSICSICGTDNTKSYCRHWPGRSYDKEAGAEVCIFKLTGAKDAYEFSLVAVPAQRAAGVCKSYTGKTVYETAENPETTPADDQKDLVKLMAIRARLSAQKAKNTSNI